MILRDASGKKIHFVSVGITRFVLLFRKKSNVHLSLNDSVKWLPHENFNFPMTEESADTENDDSKPLLMLLGELRFPSSDNILSRPLDASEQTGRTSHYLKSRILSAVRKISNQLPKTWPTSSERTARWC